MNGQKAKQQIESISETELMTEPTSKARARLQVIGARLRREWDDIVREPIPEDMLHLLLRLDEKAKKPN